ncbi:glycosyltransferase [Candidatus Parcubacteria bacterium]|nr:glycosyltransferase [Candidatus Parcubacteria bacterium]
MKLTCYGGHNLMRVDIVVPVYNDPENFNALYHSLVASVTSPWRLLLVYDKPDDTTLSVAEPLSKQDERIVLVRNQARGALPAIKTGFARVEAPATLLLMVADPPAIIKKIDTLLQKMEETGAAVVAASRYMRGGSHTGGNALKGFLSRLAGLSLHYGIGLPVHDATYATKLFRTSFLQSTPIESERGFTCAMELTLKAHIKGEKLAEVPVHWKEREVGESRFAFFGWLGTYLYWYFWGMYHVVLSWFKK